MKRLLIAFFCLIFVISHVFCSGSNETENAMSKEAGTAIGAGGGLVGGAGIGAGVGAGIGAVVGSMVPGAGTAVGAILGAKIGGLIGAIGGGTAGGIVGNELSGTGSEYVFVSTNFVIAQAGEEKFITTVTDNASLSQNYNVPSYPLGKDLYITIEMTPSLIDDVASRVSNTMKSKDVDIPVTIIIDNTESIEVTNSGGIYIENLTTDVEGYSYAEFSIKLNPEKVFPVTFKISPAEVGTSRFTVIYGTDDNPLVSRSCHRTFLIDFIEPKDE